MKHRLFTFAAAMSLLLCVAFAGLWARSYWRSYGVYLALEKKSYTAAVNRGRLEIGVQTPLLADGTFDAPRFNLASDEPVNDLLIERGWHGFGYENLDNPSGVDWRSKNVWRPLWAVVVLLAILPLAWTIRRLGKGHGPSKNRCLACGYDLTGNISGICPECGTAVAPKLDAKLTDH